MHHVRPLRVKIRDRAMRSLGNSLKPEETQKALKRATLFARLPSSLS